MKKSFDLARVLAVGGVLITGTIVIGDGTRFSDFTPLGSSAGPTADESRPITFGNAAFEQRSIVDRATQLALGYPNSGNFDMIVTNETGPHKGRYLWTVFETSNSDGRSRSQSPIRSTRERRAGRAAAPGRQPVALSPACGRTPSCRPQSSW